MLPRQHRRQLLVVVSDPSASAQSFGMLTRLHRGSLRCDRYGIARFIQEDGALLIHLGDDHESVSGERGGIIPADTRTQGA
jgi:hypothetical protein